MAAHNTMFNTVLIIRRTTCLRMICLNIISLLYIKWRETNQPTPDPTTQIIKYFLSVIALIRAQYNLVAYIPSTSPQKQVFTSNPAAYTLYP